MVKDIRLGIYACAEHEFSISRNGGLGANPYDPLETFDHIASLKTKCDHVIVLYHGGKEYYQYPTPELTRICRKMISKGASVVVCQHSHCIGCMEQYENGLILYGQGDFITVPSTYGGPVTDTGMLLSLCLSTESIAGFDFIPYRKCMTGIISANMEECQRILESFYEQSRQIMQQGFIDLQFEKLVSACYYDYLSIMNGRSNITRLMNRIFGKRWVRFFYSEKAKQKMLNYCECETHREIMLCILRSIERERIRDG